MPAHRVMIGAFGFPTKKAAETEIRRILHESPLDTDLIGHDLDLITGMVHCHPDADEKVGSGIAGIQVRIIDPSFAYGSRGFWIRHTDGSMCDISYKTALRGAKTPQGQARAAMRAAVRKDIDTFRRSAFADGTVVCPLTLQEMTLGPWAHVDHIDPPFAVIADTFAEMCGGYERLAIGSSDEHAGAAMTDPVQVVAWRLHHQQKAHLRVVHRSANLARHRAEGAA